MKLLCYPRLSTCSKRAILSKRTRWGHRNRYRPQERLVIRLARLLGMSQEAIRDQIGKERDWLLKNRRYFKP